MTDSMTTLTSLILYPIKSCGGITLDEATVTGTGLMRNQIRDRQWLVTDADGKFLTQREYPAMALITPVMADAGLVLHFPGLPPLPLAQAMPHPMVSRQVQIWDDVLPACDCGDTAASWLSSALGLPCRLVRFHPDSRRIASAKWTDGVAAPTLFADGFPLLLIGQQSLADLNRKLLAQGRQALPMNRFRPNLVIEGLEAYEEDYLESLQIGQALLKPVKPCSRCPMPSIDQDTGVIGPDPLDILQAYRANARLNGAISFGMNVILLAGEGAILRAGQAVAAELAF